MTLFQIAPPETDAALQEAYVTAWVKARWFDEWTLLSYLEPQSANGSAGSFAGSAEFLYRYGAIVQPGETREGVYTPLNLDRMFVQIRSHTPGSPTETLWHGQISTSGQSVDGSDAARVSGMQTIRAWGLIKIFDRVALNHSYIVPASGPADRINRMPDFNTAGGHGGPRLVGNRSAAKVGVEVEITGQVEEAYVFGGDEVWNNQQVVENLLVYHAPEGMYCGLSGEYEMLANITDVHRLRGLTLAQALDHLIPRQFGMGWNLETSGSGAVYVHVFSLLGDGLNILNVSLPGNSRIIDSIPVADNRNIESATFEESSAKQVDRIEVHGQPVQVCCSLSYAEGTLERGWTAAEETLYNSLGDMANTTDAALNDQERQARLPRVYQHHRVPRDWNFKAGDGTFGSTKRLVVPTVKDDGTLDTAAAANSLFNGKAFLRTIPFKKPASVTGADPEYQEPLVLVKEGTTYRQIETGETGTAQVRMTDTEFAIETAADINHVLGLNHFDTDPAMVQSDTEAVVDYENLLATVSFESDETLRVVASLGRPQTGAPTETLVIPVEDALAQYVVPQTVTGVKDGALLHHAGGVVRDDSPILRQVAALAMAWYGQKRQTLNLTVKGIGGSAPIGTYIRRVLQSSESHSIGTVVTHKSWNFQHRSQTTTIQTGYLEIDVAQLAGLVEFPGMSGPRAVAKEIKAMRGDIAKLQARTGNLPDRTPKKKGGSGSSSRLVYFEGEW